MDQLTHRDILGMMKPVGYVTSNSLGLKTTLRFHFHQGQLRWPLK